MDKVRKFIVSRLEELGIEMKEASLSMGRSHSYLQQFIKREIPRKLKEEDRRNLAKILQVSENELGGPSVSAIQTAAPTNDLLLIKEYDLTVSAGDGVVIGEESLKQDWHFNSDYITYELGLRNAKLALLEVRGDSMEPTLSSGDRVMVNMNDTQVSQPGIFIVHDGDGTVIKRVEKVYDASEPTIALISDNDRHKRYEVHIDYVTVVGRVVWAAKRM